MFERIEIRGDEVWVIRSCPGLFGQQLERRYSIAEAERELAAFEARLESGRVMVVRAKRLAAGEEAAN